MKQYHKTRIKSSRFNGALSHKALREKKKYHKKQKRHKQPTDYYFRKMRKQSEIELSQLIRKERTKQRTHIKSPRFNDALSHKALREKTKKKHKAKRKDNYMQKMKRQAQNRTRSNPHKIMQAIITDPTGIFLDKYNQEIRMSMNDSYKELFRNGVRKRTFVKTLRKLMPQIKNEFDYLLEVYREKPGQGQDLILTLSQTNMTLEEALNYFIQNRIMEGNTIESQQLEEMRNQSKTFEYHYESGQATGIPISRIKWKVTYTGKKKRRQ